MKKILFAGAIASTMCVLFSSCGAGGNDANGLAADTTATDTTEHSVISQETMEGIIESIPSPVEMSAAIKDAGAEYDKTILNPTENIDKYQTTSKKAVALGIYGGDLAYINIFEKTYSGMEYLSTIKRLAEDLKVGQFFDFESLKRLASNRGNIDSLIYISTSSFNNMDKYLRKQQRGNLSVLMVTGAWIEAVHIACKVVEEKKVKEIAEKLGEQKIILNNLLLILEIYKDDPFFSRLLSDFQAIKTELDKVSITYVYAAPETKEVNGQLVIVDNSTTEVQITEQNIKDISKAIDATRSKLIN